MKFHLLVFLFRLIHEVYLGVLISVDANLERYRFQGCIVIEKEENYLPMPDARINLIESIRYVNERKHQFAHLYDKQVKFIEVINEGLISIIHRYKSN